MEKYIQKINDKLVTEDIEKARKTKKMYQTVGGLLLAVGLAGFVALFVAFMILFFSFKTDNALTCWFITIPFLVMLVPGSVLARIGDALLPDDKETERKKRWIKYKKDKEMLKQQKELEKELQSNKED